MNQNDLPDILSKEQLTKFCHLSKRTATYLLKTGLIPSVNNGKQTRCYRILKGDVLFFCYDKERNPDKYKPSIDKFKRGKTKSTRIFHKNPIVLSEKRQKVFYRRLLSEYNGALKTPDIVEITGYTMPTVRKWLSEKHLRSIKNGNFYYVPVEYLVDFLASDFYNSINRKSVKHIASLNKMNEQDIKE